MMQLDAHKYLLTKWQDQLRWYCNRDGKVIRSVNDDDNTNKTNGGITHHNKIKGIKRQFRSGVSESSSSSAIDNIPVITKMDFATIANGTTANVTIATCDGIIPGPPP